MFMIGGGCYSEYQNLQVREDSRERNRYSRGSVQNSPRITLWGVRRIVSARDPVGLAMPDVLRANLLLLMCCASLFRCQAMATRLPVVRQVWAVTHLCRIHSFDVLATEALRVLTPSCWDTSQAISSLQQQIHFSFCHSHTRDVCDTGFRPEKITECSFEHNIRKHGAR